MQGRVAKIEEDLYRTDQANPGAIIRLDRIEHFLAIALKVFWAVGGVGLVWKAMEVFGVVMAARARV